MKLLALLSPKPGKAPPDFQPFVVAEERRLWSLYRAGVVREMYFDPESISVTFGMESGSKADAAAALDTLPMVAAGLFEINLVVLGPWLPIEALFRSAETDPSPPPSAVTDDSSSALAVVQAIYAAIADNAWDRVEARLDPEIVVHQSPALPFGGEWRGLSGFQALGRRILDCWPDFSVRPTAFYGAGETVTVLTRLQGHGAAEGPALDQEMVEVWRVRDGRVIECRPFYFDPVGAAQSAARIGRETRAGRPLRTGASAWRSPHAA